MMADPDVGNSEAPAQKMNSPHPPKQASQPVSTSADTVMTDAPSASAAPGLPPSTSTPQHAPALARSTSARATPTPGAAAVPVEPAEPPIPTTAKPHGAPARQYLNERVTGVLLEGMKRLALERPEEPLRVLGEFLLAKSRELEVGKAGIEHAVGS